MAKAVANSNTVSGGAGHDASLKLIWPVFERSLILKTFPGKEALLDALPDVGKQGNAPGQWQSDPTVGAKLKTIAIREAKRNNDAYRVPAFRCLWRLAAARDDVDMFDDILKIVTPFLDAQLEDEDRMDVDEGKGAGKEDLTAKTAEVALEAVARGYRRASMKENPATVLEKVLAALKPYLGSSRFDAIRRTTWYKCVVDLVPTEAGSGGDKNNSAADLALAYFGSLDLDKSEVGTEQQRSSRAKAAGAAAKGLKAEVFGGVDGTKFTETMAQMKAALERAVAVERSLDVQKVLKAAMAEM